MKMLPYFAVTTFIAGLAMLVVGYTFSRGGGGLEAGPSVTPIPIVLDTPTPTPTDVPTETPLPSPTPTPAPYDGALTRFRIPEFGVDAAVESIGINANNQMEVPTNPRDVGWYNVYSKPGFNGNAVFSAHVNYYGLNPNLMPFNQLHSLQPGDEIDIDMDNGLTYKYAFIGRYVYNVNTIPMGEIINGTFPDPSGQAATVERPADEQWITLITCDAGGDYKFVNGNSGPVEYLERIVVVAKRVA